MIHRLPPHSSLKVRQLANWVGEFRDKPKQVLSQIAFNPTWQVTNLNERAVALESIIHQGISRQDVFSLMNFLADNENFPVLIEPDEISENLIPEGLDRSRFHDPLEFTRTEFLRTLARLKQRSAETIAEYILQNGDLYELLPDLQKITLEIVENMLGEPYFMPINDNLRPDDHLTDFIRVLYLINEESALPIMKAFEISEGDLSLSINQRDLIRKRPRILPEYTI